MKDRDKKRIGALFIVFALIGSSVVIFFSTDEPPLEGRFHITQITEHEMDWVLEHSASIRGAMVTDYVGYHYLLIRTNKEIWEPKTPRENYWIDQNATLVVPLNIGSTTVEMNLEHKMEDISYKVNVLDIIENMARIEVEITKDTVSLFNTYNIEIAEETDETIDLTPSWNPLIQNPPRRSVIKV